MSAPQQPPLVCNRWLACKFRSKYEYIRTGVRIALGICLWGVVTCTAELGSCQEFYVRKHRRGQPPCEGYNENFTITYWLKEYNYPELRWQFIPFSIAVVLGLVALGRIIASLFRRPRPDELPREPERMELQEYGREHVQPPKEVHPFEKIILIAGVILMVAIGCIEAWFGFGFGKYPDYLYGWLLVAGLCLVAIGLYIADFILARKITLNDTVS